MENRQTLGSGVDLGSDVQRQILRTSHLPGKAVQNLVRKAFPTGPRRKFVRKMCGGIQRCAEIVRDLCGDNSRRILGWASENVRAQISHHVFLGLKSQGQ